MHEHFQFERLAKDARAKRFQFLVEVLTAGVAGDEQEPLGQFRTVLLEPFKEAKAIEFGHADVRDHEVKIGLLQSRHGAQAISDPFHAAIHFVPQHFLDHGRDILLVIHDQDAPPVQAVAVFREGIISLGRIIFGRVELEVSFGSPRQRDFKFRAFFPNAPGGDFTAVLFENTDTNAQAQAAALVGIFGGEKGIKDIFQMLRFDAVAGIGHFEHDAVVRPGDGKTHLPFAAGFQGIQRV